MIIRESPAAKKTEPETSWPPRSPREALLSSPSRLKRLQQARRHDLSPTPTKRRKVDEPSVEDQEAETDVEDDEEILRLQLKEIEIRRKLKKLQDAKKKALPRTELSDELCNSSNTAIEVGLSPKQHSAVQKLPESPKRVQLGIDKGLKATDVSLKKIRSISIARKDVPKDLLHGKPKSFSERLAELRTNDQHKDEKKRRAEIARSKGFGIQKPVSMCADVAHTGKLQPSAISAVAVPSQLTRSSQSDSLAQEKYKAAAKQGGLQETCTGFFLSKQHLDAAILSNAIVGKTVVSIPQLLKGVTSPDYDLPDFPTEDFVITGIIASKSTPRDQQKATTLKGAKGETSDSTSPKFMVVTLTDLQWSIDLFLFDTGFSRFWKLTVGTVVAILNPGIMPPKPNMRDTGRFSLKLSSSEDTVLEIGMAQDLGFCSSIKKDGRQCGQWIDKRKTEFCDFHVNLAIEKTTSKRMEINGMSSMGLFGMSKSAEGNGNKGRGSGQLGNWKRGRVNKDSKHGGQFYDRQLGEKGYIVPPEFSSGRNTAKLLDADDHIQGALSSKERSRKRLADREKERELSQQLAEAGRGMGGEYMRIKGRPKGQVPSNPSKEAYTVPGLDDKKDATELGLVGTSAADVTLSPVKGRRARSGEGAQPMGWSGAFKRGLLSPSRRDAPLRPQLGVLSNDSDNVPGGTGGQDTTIIDAQKTGTTTLKTAMVHDDNDDDDDGLDIV